MKRILICLPGFILGIIACYYINPLLMRTQEKGVQEPVWVEKPCERSINISDLVPLHQAQILYFPVPPRKILPPYEWKYKSKREKDSDGNEITREYQLHSTPEDLRRAEEERDNEQIGTRSVTRGGETWCLFYLENLSKNTRSYPFWDLKIYKGFRGPMVFEVGRSILLEPGDRKRVEIDITPYIEKGTYYQGQVSIEERSFSGCVIEGPGL